MQKSAQSGHTASFALLRKNITCADPNDGVGPSLPCRPRQLEEVKATFVADFAANAVGRLSDWMPMEGQLVVLLHEDVVRPEEVDVVF